MATLRARYARIERTVEAILASAPDGPPVAVEAMVGERGIDLRKGDLGEISGLLVRNGGNATIGVNAKQHRYRQRFTIAHELGHFMLHEGIAEHVDDTYRITPRKQTEDEVQVLLRSDISSQATDVMEIEANFFAASLLMPKKMLDHHDAMLALDDDMKVRQLAVLFQVSAHAMSLRLANIYRRYTPY